MVDVMAGVFCDVDGDINPMVEITQSYLYTHTIIIVQTHTSKHVQLVTVRPWGFIPNLTMCICDKVSSRHGLTGLYDRENHHRHR